MKHVLGWNRWSWRGLASMVGLLAAASAPAAQGEMGTGIPTGFAIYSAPAGMKIILWGLGDPRIPFPAGCSFITLTPATMGMDSYKMAYAGLLFAKQTNRPMRFYAHAPRDEGCGVDYFQVAD